MKNKVTGGIIYKAKNTVTMEIYIGATTKSVEIRIKDHLDKASRGKGHKLHQAIATYGPDAFRFEQIDTANSIDELAQKEKQHIMKYQSQGSVYNSDSGGGIMKTVYKYDFSGKLASKFSCLDDAAKTVDSTKQGISSACLSVNKKHKGYYWSYHYQNPFKPERDMRKKKVYQYSLGGEFIAEFISVAQASRSTGASKTSIAKVCRGEFAKSNGFIWRYNLKADGDEV